MSIYETINEDYKAALKGKDALKVSVLRMVIAAVKMLELQKSLTAVDDADAVQVIQKQAKQRKESIDQFLKGDRKDLADKEAAELKILEAYMPRQMTAEELKDVVRSVIAEIGAAGKADTGRVMKAVMERVRGKADGKAVNQVVAGLLP